MKQLLFILLMLLLTVGHSQKLFIHQGEYCIDLGTTNDMFYSDGVATRYLVLDIQIPLTDKQLKSLETYEKLGFQKDELDTDFKMSGQRYEIMPGRPNPNSYTDKTIGEVLLEFHRILHPLPMYKTVYYEKFSILDEKTMKLIPARRQKDYLVPLHSFFY